MRTHRRAYEIDPHTHTTHPHIYTNLYMYVCTCLVVQPLGTQALVELPCEEDVGQLALFLGD